MNIVKFKDIITESDFYNQYLKDKYALAINFLYVFPLNVSGLTDYTSSVILLEQAQIHEMPADEISVTINGETFNLFKNTDYVLFSDYQEYISDFGDLDKYIKSNNFSPDSDITLEELKRFRTWLAEILLDNSEFIDEWSKDPDKHKNMLQYYTQEMYDAVVKALVQFDNYVDVNNITKQSGCGCQGAVVSYTINSLSVCDPLLIYRHNIYKYMIEIFSNISYWEGQIEICEEMKKYIDNIIKVGLPLVSTTLYSNFADCTCMNANIDEQTTMTNILKRLSQSLDYIIKNETSGNRNYISSSFLDWSTYLYEKMRW